MDWGTISAIAALASINIAILMGLISWLRSDMKAFESEIRVGTERYWQKTEIFIQNSPFKI